MDDEHAAWREALAIRVAKLKIDRFDILQLDAAISEHQFVSPDHRKALLVAVRAIETEIQRIESEIVLDDILSGDFTLEDGTIKAKS